MDKLILIDGNSLLFRAYFAMRPMVTSSGIYTQGIFAFINMLNKIIHDYEPTHLAVAFDMKEKTFRHDRYAEYKAGRLSTPIELLTEIPLLHQVLEAMNIKVLEMPKYEADDLIGTASKRAAKDGFKVLVISGDKDELQLVDENINVLINKKGMSDFDLYDIDAMRERYNLTAEQFVDLKALMGDKSDNIPGVPGVGEKKGISLLEEYESLENVLAHADEIKGKLGENIRDNIDQAVLSKWLATINVDSPISLVWDELKFVEPDYNKLIEIYTELEFSSFIKKLGDNVSKSINDDNATSDSIVNDLSDVSELSLEEFLKNTDDYSEVCAVALSDNNHLAKPEISRILLYSAKGKCYCCKSLTALDSYAVVDAIAKKEFKLIGFDLKRLLYSFIQYTDKPLYPIYDIMVAEYLLDANRSKYSIEKMLLRYNSLSVGENDISLNDDMGPMALAAVTNENLLKRAYCINLVKLEQEKALSDKCLLDLFSNCEMPLTLTLANMEREGILVDRDVLNQIGDEINERIAELELNIYNDAGTHFNINSPKQLGDILFVKMGLPYPKGKTSSYSTAADVLDKLKPDYKIVREVLEYRKLAKLRSTYIDGILALVGDDGKIHPHFQQTVASTGRLSCTEPNLQNIPIRDEYGRLIRKAFIAQPGNIFTGADYSQIELRILAALSGDELLISAFNEGKDIHRATASNVFNIPFEDVTIAERSKAKAVNFGVVYGMSGFGLSENLDITRTEAQHYINDYFNKHTAVKEYLDRQVDDGEMNQEVRTFYGRLRQIPEFTSRKFMEREAAKRLAMNTPIQGTAADIIKFAMNSVAFELIDQNLQSKLVLQIHDELIIEGPKSELELVKDILDRCMTNAAELAVKLTVDIHSGQTWYDLK